MDALRRAEEAQKVVENPTYQNAFAEVEQYLVDKWKASTSKDEREALHMEIKALARVQRNLLNAMVEGKLYLVERDRVEKEEATVGRSRVGESYPVA